jgi:hypothetical protein
LGDREAPCVTPGVDAVQTPERGDVDELDDRRDHDGGERRQRQLLEQPRQQEQREHREHGHDQPGELGARAGRSVHGGLGERAVDDHPARQARGDVRPTEPEQLPVRVDLVMLAASVRLRGPEALREADEHDADAARHERAVVVQRGVGRAERREAAVDRADDLDAVVVEVEQGGEHDPDRHGDQRPGDGRRRPPQAQHDGQRQRPDRQRAGVHVAEPYQHVPRLLEEVP